MEDQELRTRLAGIEQAIERVEDAAREAATVLTSMRVGDADARADVKIALAELRTSATAMRDAAVGLQKAQLVGETAPAKGPTWKQVAIGFAIAIATIALALGGKEIIPALLKALGV